MKKTLLFLLLAFGCKLAVAQGYEVTVQYKPVSNGYLYLGYYFGDKKYLKDSALLQPDGKVVFAGTETLVGGLYIIVDPAKKQFFDVLIDKEQHFSIRVDTSSFTISKINGSSENNYLEAYKKSTAFIYKDFQAWQTGLSQAKTKQDSSAIQKKMTHASQLSQHWRDSFSLVHPQSYLTLLFRLMKEPEYKIAGAKSKQDSITAFYQYKKQYWQDISFADERLLRTPMFEQRLNRYFEQAVYMHPDSVKPELDKFILYSRTNKTMFKYFINKFTNEYMNPKYMGFDVVFLHLFEKYYLPGDVDWLEKKDKDLVFNRAYSLMGNIIGEPAADLNLLDTLDKKTNLYSLQSAFTLVIFWDPDCSHCKEVVPKLDSLYRNRWKKMGVKIAGILTDTVRTDIAKMPLVKSNWMNYIHEHKLDEWLHLYQTPQMREIEIKAGTPGFRQLYDVYQTPTIYLLDEQKRIVAKKITPEQVDEFLQFKQNNQSSKHP